MSNGHMKKNNGQKDQPECAITTWVIAKWHFKMYFLGKNINENYLKFPVAKD